MDDPTLFQTLLNLHLKLEVGASPLEQESELLSAIGVLLERQKIISSTGPPPGKEPSRLKIVVDYLKSNYATNVSLSQLASLVDLNPSYLLRVFRDHTGVPPHEYQIQLRVAHARTLICEGMSISKAAQETGFFDHSHFTRNFKRIVGMPPSAYLSHVNIVQDTT